MNEQPLKKILFNKSTLLSLKAELLKKQEEVNEKKRLPQHKLENFKPVPTKTTEKNDDLSQKTSFKDRLKQTDTEELEAFKKSKAILEKKAELYDHLSDAAGTSQLASRFLVDFDVKKHQEPPKRSVSPELVEIEKQFLQNVDDDEDWTEFTDCLGRTRRCLKTDLNLYQKKDKELLTNTTKQTEYSPDCVQDVEVPQPVVEKPLLVQKTNDYLQLLRQKWEQKEQELLGKDKDIHYQDILFDEARQHGVGYFSFSTDEAERRKQMEHLTKIRQETISAQKVTADERRKRGELVAARVAAARARRRMREGLPPEDPEEIKKEYTRCLLEFLTQQKNEADAKAKEEETKKKEEEEIERQKQREAYVREWDLGKEGVDDTKKFREMTQEEYVAQQRDRRINEFAPPKETNSKRTDSSFDDRGRMQSLEDNLTQPKTWSDVRPKPQTPPPPEISDLNEQKGLYFSTAKKGHHMKYKNFVKPQEPVPIENELSDDEDKVEVRKPEKREHVAHNKIAPPPTYDYYGPVTKKIKIKKPFESDMREAFAQGSKSLEKPDRSNHMSHLYDFSLE